MAIDRRASLGLLAAGLAAPLLPRPLHAASSGRVFLSARADAGGGYRVSGFAAFGAPAFDLPLPGRGHSFAVRPDNRIAVHFSRRPGSFALAIDLARGVARTTFAAPPDRHLYGHGVFGPDGRLLYATENDFATGRGVIGIYDARNGYARLGELPSHGIGPHEIRLLSDGTTLAVANGGIATRPDLPRVKLNLPTMDPSLCYIDRRNGALLGNIRLPEPLRQLSIRHLAVGPDDRVAVAMQDVGPSNRLVPLVANPDNPPALFLIGRRGQPACWSPFVAANDRALGLLRGDDRLADQGGYLQAAIAEENAELQGLLARALPPFGGQGAAGSMTMTRSAGMAQLALHVSPVGERNRDDSPRGVAALVLVHEPESRAGIDPAQVSVFLGLTPMEGQVAALLAEGRTVTEVALALGRSHHTVRWHMKHVFQKLDVTRQAELALLVSSMAGLPLYRR